LYNKGEKRTKIIAFEDAFHGDTFGAMASSGITFFTVAFQGSLIDVIRIPVPTEGIESKSKEALQKAILSNSCAAFIFEPLVQGAAGMVMYAPEILDELISTPSNFGVEIDVRTSDAELIISHEPFSSGTSFSKWLEHYSHSCLIINVKEDGLETFVLDLLNKYEIENFLISQDDIKNNDFFKELSYLSGVNIQSYKKIKKGGNNKIFKVFSTTNDILLVKKYCEDNKFKRASSEKLAYRIFKDIASLPKCIWSPNSMDAIALNWIDGVEISQINSNHLEQSIKFIEEIKKIKVDPSVNLAKEAVIEWGDLIQHIDARILRLKQVDNLVLSRFLDMRLCPLWDNVKRELVDNLTKLPTNEISLDLKNQIYSPSDFGFHNAIEDKKGKVFFVDFEYFGRDDPVKMIVDFWWHPAMNLTKWQKEYWKNRIEKETNEPYQMIYIDISIIDKKNKKIYFYSSYDLSSGDEYGIGINLCIKRKKIK
jgi:hypothetical protein